MFTSFVLIHLLLVGGEGVGVSSSGTTGAVFEAAEISEYRGSDYRYSV